MGKKLKRKSFLQNISTMPSPESFYWAQKQFSILAAVLLWSIWLSRIFSPLQWFKYVYRVIVTAHLKHAHKKDQSGEKNGSGRVNVPPLLCEVYYILWMVFFALVYTKMLFVPHWVIQLTTTLFLFESVVWVLYYTIFRRFFESRYSIYHELEYLSELILVILTQALCFSLRYERPFLSMLVGLLGAGTDSTPVLVTVLGVVVMAIVVSMIISAFPTEKVKKYTPKSKMFILGNGDVVKERLLPALKTLKNDTSRVYTLPADGDPEPDEKSIQTYCQLIRDNMDHNSIVWVETPTYTHVDYLKELLDMPVELIVLEKPITADMAELTYVEKILSDTNVRNKIFFQNYYLLEKALPLIWLLYSNSCYLKYLDIDHDFPVEDWQEQLGRMTKLEVQILEAKESRIWTLDPQHGGQWLETFIHNVQLATHLVKSPYKWEQICSTRKACRNELHAWENGTQIHLLQEKGVPKEEQTRYLEACYEKGRIFVYLEEQFLCMELADAGKPYYIRVNDDWKQKYLIITDLVLRVKRNQIPVWEADGLYDELLVNRWLLEQLDDTTNQH